MSVCETCSKKSDGVCEPEQCIKQGPRIRELELRLESLRGENDARIDDAGRLAGLLQGQRALVAQLRRRDTDRCSRIAEQERTEERLRRRVRELEDLVRTTRTRVEKLERIAKDVRLCDLPHGCDECAHWPKCPEPGPKAVSKESS